MDWNLKLPPWDMAELDPAAEQNLGSVVAGLSNGPALRRPGSGLECSVDLKLGGVGDPGSSYKWKEQPRTPSSTAAPPKRQRGLGIASLNALCSVEGCKADLSKCREYHRRHKVCEVHSKTPVVVVGGQEQRFCQQCSSRFHLLVEFDEVKRSCRKHLDGHNRRRRKPQPNSGNSGTRYLPNPQFFPTTTTEPNWAGILKAEDNTIYIHSTAPDLTFCPSSSYSYNSKERKQFPFLQESDTSLSSITTLGSLVEQSHLMTTSTSTISGVVGSKMFSNALTQALHSDCALSLLSSPPTTRTTHKSGIDLGHRVLSSVDRIPMAQPLVSSLQCDDLRHYSHLASKNVSPILYSCSVVGDEHASAALVSNADEADVHCPNIFHIGGGEGSSDGASQSLPFSWQ